MRGRLRERGNAAGREHDERLGQPRLACGRGQRREVTRSDRREIRVGGDRRRALVLAELGCELVRRDDAHVRIPPAQLVCDGDLVTGIAKRKEKADRNCVDIPDVGQGFEIECLQLAVGPEPSADAVAALERHERVGVLRAQAVQVRARLPAQVQQVLAQWAQNPIQTWKAPALRTVLTTGAFSGKRSTPYAPGSVHDYMHAKLTVCDDTVFVGSFNLSRSGETNAENVLEIEDAAIADRMAAFIDEVRARYPPVEVAVRVRVRKPRRWRFRRKR